MTSGDSGGGGWVPERARMIAVMIALVFAVGCAVVGMTMGLIDEVRKRRGPFRRAGSALAMIASFAGLWLLITPVELGAVECGAPVLMFAQWMSDELPIMVGCAEVMVPYVVAGALLSLAAPLLVVATRGPAA